MLRIPATLRMQVGRSLYARTEIASQFHFMLREDILSDIDNMLPTHPGKEIAFVKVLERI